MIVFALIGELTPISACVMLGQYALLVLLVWWQERGKPKEKEEEKEKGDKEADNESPKKNLEDKKKRLAEKDLIAFDEDKTDEEKVA